MKRITELQRRESRLRYRMAGIQGHPIELTPADRIAISRELAEMQMIVERHLAGLPERILILCPAKAYPGQAD